jgi:hypothetical protein
MICFIYNICGCTFDNAKLHDDQEELSEILKHYPDHIRHGRQRILEQGLPSEIATYIADLSVAGSRT